MAKTYYADKTPKISKLYTDEIFKDVEGFNGNLKISNYGRAWENEKITFSGKNHRIKKVIPARILKLQDNGVGYLQVVTKINILVVCFLCKFQSRSRTRCKSRGIQLIYS